MRTVGDWIIVICATAFLVAALAMLSACASTPKEQPVRIVEKQVPVPVKCAVDPGPKPTYPDTDDALKAASDLFERVKLLLAGRALRTAREGQLEAAVAGCK